MVGGPCTYETIYGIARIYDQDCEGATARFYSQNRHSEGDPQLPFRSLEFPVTLPIYGGIGTIYPAELRVRTKGSCSPRGMDLLAAEKFNRCAAIRFDTDGQINPGEKNRLSQLAMTFKKLAPSWPQMHLDICGQTSSEGTEEYNLNLGGRHARKIAQELEALGVPHSQIKTSSTGESPCPRSIWILDEPQHGACLYFILTDTHIE